MTPLEKIRAACIKANPEIVNRYCCALCENEGGCGNRPIRLADVLLAIQDKYGVESPVMVNAFGGVYYFTPLEGNKTENKLLGYYDLSHDNLESQSPETVLLLSELL